jgi:hypothetical protein
VSVVAQTHRILKFVVGIHVAINWNGGGERLSVSLFGTCSVSRAPYKLTRKLFVCVTDLFTSFESGRILILFNSNLHFLL